MLLSGIGVKAFRRQPESLAKNPDIVYGIIALILGATSEEIVLCGRPRGCFNMKGDWVVMAHNLDDAGDVKQVGGAFPTRTQADAEAERFQRSPQF